MKAEARKFHSKDDDYDSAVKNAWTHIKATKEEMHAQTKLGERRIKGCTEEEQEVEEGRQT